MRKPSAEADWKSAIRGDREVMFEVVMTVVNYPGAEVNWCEWWIENMQRQDVHRRREFSLLIVFWLFRIAHFLA